MKICVNIIYSKHGLVDALHYIHPENNEIYNDIKCLSYNESFYVYKNKIMTPSSEIYTSFDDISYLNVDDFVCLIDILKQTKLVIKINNLTEHDSLCNLKYNDIFCFSYESVSNLNVIILNDNLYFISDVIYDILFYNINRVEYNMFIRINKINKIL